MKKIVMLLAISIGLLFGATNKGQADWGDWAFCKTCNYASCMHISHFRDCARRCKGQIPNCTSGFCQGGCTREACKNKENYLLCHKVCRDTSKAKLKDKIKNCKEHAGKENRNAGRQESKARNEARRAKKAAAPAAGAPADDDAGAPADDDAGAPADNSGAADAPADDDAGGDVPPDE